MALLATSLDRSPGVHDVDVDVGVDDVDVDVGVDVVDVVAPALAKRTAARYCDAAGRTSSHSGMGVCPGVGATAR
jgi:hypothetical protein